MGKEAVDWYDEPTVGQKINKECSDEHASLEKDQDGNLAAISLCVKNCQTELLQKIIKNKTKLIMCYAHREEARKSQELLDNVPTFTNDRLYASPEF